MRKTLSMLAIVAMAAILPAATASAHSADALRGDMRQLWIDHAAWTRMYIISAAAGSPDTNVVAQRLLRNQDDIGNAVAGFYGAEAGKKLTALLKDHILIAAELVGAAKAGNNAKVAEANARWHRNANDIASFLHGANPKNWPEATLQSMMKTHLDQTLQEATDRLQGKYDADIRDYDEIEKHMVMMADALSSGIIAQFPSKFRRAWRSCVFQENSCQDPDLCSARSG